MKTAFVERKTALWTIAPLAAGALALLLMTGIAAGQQAAAPPKAAAQAKMPTTHATGAQGKTSDAAKPTTQNPNTLGMVQVPKVVVPDVRGRTQGAAQEILQRAGLRLGTTRQSGGPGTPGTVSQQYPPQESVVVRGTAVNVAVVATPQTPKPDQHDNEFVRAVPSLIGSTPAQAQLMLNRAGLNLGNQAVGTGNGVEGTIYAQNPQPGQWVHLTSRVDVQIVQASQPSTHNKTPEPATVIVPQLRGQTIPAARQLLAGSELQPGNVSTRQVAAPAGTIYDQRPQAGAKVRAGTSVDLLVAAEKPQPPQPPQPTPQKPADKPTQKPADKPVEKPAEKIVLVPVPDVRHRDANTAATILQQSRLRLGQQTRQESESNPGLISSQSPQPGTRVEAGSTVDILVAVAIPPVTVPNVIRLDEGMAVTDLGESRLRLGSLAQRDSDEVSGTVLAQSPAAGAQVPRDSSVNLTVSRQIQRTLTVMVDDPTPEAGKPARFHAHLDQGDSGFQYQFVFGDAQQSEWANESTVTHVYETPGSYVVTATASRGAVRVPSAGVGVAAKEIEFHIKLTATPRSAKAGYLVAFQVENDRKDIRPLYQFEFADGKQSDWSNEPFAQHSYERTGTYVTKVRARVGSGRIIESATEEVVEGSFPPLAAILIAVGLTGIGIGAFVYHGWKQFLKWVRAVPRMDAGEQNLVMQNREGWSEEARLRMVWPRGEQLVEWVQGHGSRKAEGHD
jgi:beta-lactam-binding protein with PASTA domain